MSAIHDDHVTAMDMHESERDAILESVSSDVWWDTTPDSNAHDAYVMDAMRAAWDAASTLANSLAFETLRGRLGDNIIGPRWGDVTENQWNEAWQRNAATVANLTCSGAAYVAGMAAREAWAKGDR